MIIERNLLNLHLLARILLAWKGLSKKLRTRCRNLKKAQIKLPIGLRFFGVELKILLYIEQ